MSVHLIKLYSCPNYVLFKYVNNSHHDISVYVCNYLKQDSEGYTRIIKKKLVHLHFLSFLLSLLDF